MLNEQFMNEPTPAEIQARTTNEFWTLEWWNCANQRWENVTFDFLFPSKPTASERNGFINRPQPGVRLRGPKTTRVDWHTADAFWAVNGKKINAVGKDATGIWYRTEDRAPGDNIYLRRGETTIEVQAPR